MDTPFEKELIGREQAFWQALKDDDVDAAVRLTHDPCIVTGAQGISRLDRATFAKMMRGANYKLEEFDLDSFEVEKLSDDVAIIGYKVREKMTVDGKPLTLEAADTSTWVKKDGEWLCAMHTEALAGDPFGRDRQKQ
jgi:ketosteroid isomerase-like protein